GRIPEQTEARAGDDVVHAQRHRQAEEGELVVQALFGRGCPAGLEDEVQAVGGERRGPDVVGGRADLLAQIGPDEDAHQRRQAVPEPERERDLRGPLPAESANPEHDRGTEVVQAEGESDDEETAEHEIGGPWSGGRGGCGGAAAARTPGPATPGNGRGRSPAGRAPYSGSAKANSADPPA